MFTFKTEKPTGQFRSFFTSYVNIKLKRIIVGQIVENKVGPGFKIMLKVIKKDITEDGNTNCTWKWITLKGLHNTENDAKAFINSGFQQILDTFNLVKE